MRRSVAIALLAASCHSVHAHGFAGNRFLPGTLTMDDSAVADEAILPAYSNLKHPAESGRHSRQQDTSFLVKLHQQQELISRKISPG
jgi:hypothetical protein